MMMITDFSRSFLTFRIDSLEKPVTTMSHKPPYTLNNARIQLDCLCSIQEKNTGLTYEFVLGASCKTEIVNVDRDIWLQPNADFVPIFSSDQFITIKTYDTVGKVVMYYPPNRGPQPERHSGVVADSFESVDIHVTRTEGITLESNPEVIKATLGHIPLVARTTIEAERYISTLEYPVKTMNASEREGFYQTDTGPVLMPDLSRQPEDLVNGFELAFSAFNSPTWTEFIIRSPVEVAPGVKVHHYSRPLRLDCRNEITRLRN